MDDTGTDYEITAEYYDHVIPYRERDDVDFYVGQARASEGPVLELGCGTGRILVPTALSGVEIVGLDAARPMLERCRERTRELAPEVRSRVTLVRGDMRSFELAPRFALVTIPFRGLQHLLRVEDQVRCLRAIRRHLAPDGRLIFDVFYPDMARIADESTLGVETGHEPEFAMPDGSRVVRSHRHVARDLAAQRLHIELIHAIEHPDGRRQRRVERLDMRYFFRFELEHLLARCGFELVSTHADFRGTPLGAAPIREIVNIAVLANS